MNMNRPCLPKLHFFVLSALTCCVALSDAQPAASTPAQIPAPVSTALDPEMAALSPYLRSGIDMALPRINQAMPDAPATLVPIGFILFNEKAGDKQGWCECPAALPVAGAEPGLQNRVLGDILAQVQNALGQNEAQGVLVFAEQGGCIRLYVRNEAGAEICFMAQRTEVGKSDLKPGDFKLDRAARRLIVNIQPGVAS